jgi:hypothetical protein
MSGSGSWYHLSVKTVGRSAGRSVVAAAAYRLGLSLHDAEIDRTHDYTRRHGVKMTFVFAPEVAPDWVFDPTRLWNEANAAEKRKNSTLAREAELALPASLTDDARARIVQDFSQALVDRYGVAVTAAIHEPSRHGNQANFHAHILFTTRAIDADGFGKKTRVLDDQKTGPVEIVWLREHAANLINAALADGGSDERVDHRSFADRGLVKEPTMHLGPKATEIERRGEISELGDVNRDVKNRNAQLDSLVDELAALDAEIVQAEEQRLDDRYGDDRDVERASFTEAAQEPSAGGSTALRTLRDRRAAELTSLEMPDPGLAVFLPEPSDTPRSPAFKSVEERRISEAIAHHATTQMEAKAPGRRLAKLRSWFGQFREYVAGWRETIQERADHYLAAWEKDEMRERAAEQSPDHRPRPDMEHDR